MHEELAKEQATVRAEITRGLDEPNTVSIEDDSGDEDILQSPDIIK
jgi:hypothetical protein